MPESVESLEKQLRILQKKLSRSEQHRVDLEDQRERDQWLYRKLQAEVETAHRATQVEAALERVRARAMAMQSSDDLADAMGAVFQELEGIGVDTIRCGITIVDEANRELEAWVATPTDDGQVLPVAGVLPVDGSPELSRVFDAWQSGAKKLQYVLEGDDLDRYYESIADDLPLPEFEAHRRSQVCSLFFFVEGALYCYTAAPLGEEAERLFERFAGVFALTYRRYLDLAEAEARARQAEEQAALDRVRAEIASMRTAEDLERITPLVWRELTTLGVPFIRCGVFIMDEPAREVEAFLSTPEGTSLATMRIPYDAAQTTVDVVAHWRRQAVFSDVWDGEQFEEWTNMLASRGLIEDTEPYRGGGEGPQTLALLFAPFEQGMLYVGSEESLAAEVVESVQALAGAFAVAYARYEDFGRLEAKNREVEAAMSELRAAQAQLVQSEKMASLGQLTAGIAHEIKNPLNFVNNFAGLSRELLDDLDATSDASERLELMADLKLNVEKIEVHGRRADGIVRSMMEHARSGSGDRRIVSVNDLVAEYTEHAVHAERVRHPEFRAEFVFDRGDDAGEIELVPQEIGRVLINLVGNALDAVRARAGDGAAAGDYSPRVTASTRRVGDAVEIVVADNGVGMSKDVLAKVFEPFFTTKPTGEGTGLGLSMSYDIVTQGHGGSLEARQPDDGEGAEFVMWLPSGNGD